MKLWIARMWSQDLYIFKEKPVKNTTKGSWDSSEPMKDVGYRINSRWFPEITFENSPQEVELKFYNDNTLDIIKEKMSKMKELHPEFAQIIEEDFWDLVF